MNGPKQNPNPVVLSVDKPLSSAALDYPELRSLSMNNPSSFNSDDLDPSPEDRAILQALTDSSLATDGKSTSLLRSLGLVIPITEGIRPITSPPRYVPPSGGNTFNSTGAVAVEAAETESPQGLNKNQIDEQEVFEIIRNIQDPEHDLTLEQLGVVSLKHVKVQQNRVHVRFTPTIPQCGMATQIGLCLATKLNRSLPRTYRTRVSIQPGSHNDERALNKQLADKERMCAALENKHLRGIVDRCILNGMNMS